MLKKNLEIIRYNKQKFFNAYNYYKSSLRGKVENKLTFVILDIKCLNGFYSLAPLSMAIHDLGGDMHVMVNNPNFQILEEIWDVYERLERGILTPEVIALKEFLEEVGKKTKINDLFVKPEVMLYSNHNFYGSLDLDFKPGWYKPFKWKELIKTCSVIWREGYDLKPKEIVSIGFELIPSKQKLELPIQDYLDSFSIAMAMATTAMKLKAQVIMGACTNRSSGVEKAVRSADLMATLKGCELDKMVDEAVFKKFKVLSRLMRINRLVFPSAGFGIHGKGYFGKHIFGEDIGYPSLNKKTRWSSPGQLMLKDRYAPQTKLEPRDPMMRYAITETLPIELFIETCNIDYLKLWERSKKIRDLLNKCVYVHVKGEFINNFKTDFFVYLLGKKRREFTAQDSDVRSIIDKEYYKKTGIKAGSFANFPSGETFVTPEYVEGTLVGDVVINIDQSYVLPENEPLVISFSKKGYKILAGPKKILKIIEKERRDVIKRIKNFEKQKSLPPEIVRIYKQNLNSVGEFAINTNPKARLSNYLIVNEKIANMIHLALGSGFEPDKVTLYHWDIVVNSPKQKLDIYGVDKNNKKYWIHKNGKFVV